MKRVYMSVEEGFEKTPEPLYRTSKKIIEALDSLVDLTLVHPRDYCLEDNTINRGFKFVKRGEIKESLSKHKPKGDMFIIYGDETSKNIGLDFARDQYNFLRNIKDNGNFKHFFNTPETEEMTLKDQLVDLSKNKDLAIASTYNFESKNQIGDLISQYGFVIMKPIFGCRGSGVTKINDLDELVSLNLSDSYLRENYIFQEPLSGAETRVVLLDNDLLCSRIHYDRKLPWDKSKSQKTYVHNPSSKEIEITRAIGNLINADIIGVDFIGDKVNEINGTGTGLVIYDHENNLLYDNSSKFVERVMKVL